MATKEKSEFKNEVVALVTNNGRREIVKNRRVRVGSVYLKTRKAKVSRKSIFLRTEGKLPQSAGVSQVYGHETYTQGLRLGEADLIWVRETAQANGMTAVGFLNVLIRSAREEMGDLGDN